MKNIFRFLGLIAGIVQSTFVIAQVSQLPNLQSAPVSVRPQPSPSPLNGASSLPHTPNQAQPPGGVVSAPKPLAPILEHKSQTPEVSTSIITNQAASVAISTLRSINENLDTTSAPGGIVSQKLTQPTDDSKQVFIKTLQGKSITIDVPADSDIPERINMRVEEMRDVKVER